MLLAQEMELILLETVEFYCNYPLAILSFLRERGENTTQRGYIEKCRFHRIYWVLTRHGRGWEWEQLGGLK